MITKKQASVGGATLATAGTTTGIVLANKKDSSLSVDDNNEEYDSQSINQENEVDSDTDAFKSDGSQPQFTVLSLESGFSTKYPNTSDNQTLGGLYGGYFVGTYGTNNTNENWWKKSYENWETSKNSENLSDEFKEVAVDSAFTTNPSSDSDKALNRVCEKVYLKKTKEIKFKDYKYGNEDNNDKKLIRDLIKYCSPMKRIPKTIEESGESNYGTNSIGSTKKKILVSVIDSSNDSFWKLRNDDFFRDNNNYWSGNFLNSKSTAPVDLKNLYNQKTRTSSNESFDIKKICKEKYPLSDLPAQESNQYVYYCSWNSTLFDDQ